MSAHAHASANDSSAMSLPTPVTAKSQLLTNSSNAVLLLQRKCVCGSPTASLTGECAGCKSKKLLQTKLTIGASNDPLEQEADRVADHVLAGPANPAVIVAPLHIQRFTGQPNASAGSVGPASVDRVLASPGRPLEPALRLDMEQRFGHDFSLVRVHSDTAAEKSAREANSHAYTVGSHIVFGAGQYRPRSSSGAALLAHELTHTVQQTSLSSVMALQRSPASGSTKALPSLEELGHGIAQLLLGEKFGRLGLFRGKVLSVVRDDLGRIYIGLNEGLPAELTDVMDHALEAQKARIVASEVIVTHTSEIAVGGHAEVIALNNAIAKREEEIGRALTEVELRGFELHNVWLSGGDRVLTAAARCEHCARITRGVSVTNSVFHAEGGVSGSIDTTKLSRTRPVPLTPAATTASGEIDVGRPRPGGPGGSPSGSSSVGTVEGTVDKFESKIEGVGGIAIAESAGAEGIAIAKSAGFGAKAAQLGSFLLEMAIPGPLDVLFLWISFFGSLAEAKEKLRSEYYALGFAEGIAARVLGVPADQATKMLLKPVSSHGSVVAQVAGVGRVRENATNSGAVDGWNFAGQLKYKQRGAFLKEGFARIKEKGHTIGPNFNLDDVTELGVALKPLVEDLLEAASEQEMARQRAEAQRRWVERREAAH
jgi:hypothetical protein